VQAKKGGETREEETELGFALQSHRRERVRERHKEPDCFICQTLEKGEIKGGHRSSDKERETEDDDVLVFP
jgi:hypothetical protein